MDWKEVNLKTFVFAVCYVLIVFPTWSQNYKISGVVKDTVNNVPVPHAHVAVGHLVTLTNNAGEFVLSFDKLPDDYLLISYTGYHSCKIPVQETGSQYEIFLDPFEVILEEASHTAGQSIMQHVVSRIPINYEHEARSFLSYYKERLTGNDSLYYLAEGILDIYLPSNVSTDLVKVSPIKTRKKTIHAAMKDEVTMVKGHATDMVQSSIWREGSFLNAKNRDNYTFNYSGKKLHGEVDVYIVEFSPKNKKGYVSGSIYVEDKSFAIRKLEYYPQAEKSSFWNEIMWTEEFDDFDGTYHLVSSSFQGTWEERGTRFEFSSVLVNNEITIVKVEPAMGDFLSRKDMFFHAASDNFTDSFWESYNFIKLDDVEGSIQQ